MVLQDEIVSTWTQPEVEVVGTGTGGTLVDAIVETPVVVVVTGVVVSVVQRLS